MTIKKALKATVRMVGKQNKMKQNKTVFFCYDYGLCLCVFVYDGLLSMEIRSKGSYT